jgi:hypothetical protein
MEVEGTGGVDETAEANGDKVGSRGVSWSARTTFAGDAACK